ncbi:MAG: hypothetical protein ACK5A3_14340, partial [Planctomyces sp.]
APTRRSFLQSASLASLATAAAPYWFAHSSTAAPLRSPNDRPVLGCIGTGDRWIAVGPQAMNFSDRAAVCDVDRNDIDVVTILTHKHGSRAAQPFHCAPPNLIGLSFFNRTVAEGKTQFIPGTLARISCRQNALVLTRGPL